ncbi:MAG: hypothetical protein J6W10_06470 [Kiritimatiellae bacterium]|nr:hypothetical protein [Kiritimatiellia bacterium]
MDEKKKNENGLAMSDFEISQSWRLAKDKEDQIKVLANLNCCDPAKLRARLWYAQEPGSIGPVEIMAAAEKLLSAESKCNSFGQLRNYLKTWAGISGKEAKKIFKDWLHRPWGTEELEAWDVEGTRAAAAQALDTKRVEQQEPKKVSIAAAYTPFTELELAAEMEALRLYREKLLDAVDDCQNSIDALVKDLDLFKAARDKYNEQLQLLNAVEKKIKGGHHGKA